ncbi:MAG: ABC transporter ATP-binding protein [Treponema sp.]|nr:ABC transporter ATP-binding protein [Treponema sp.]
MKRSYKTLSTLRIENISKSFGGKNVLRDISLSINEGEFVSLLGPSGCGKTTLFKLIAGLEAPDSGSIFIGGKCCDNIPARKRGALIVFQDYGLFPHMTVMQNIEFGLTAQKITRSERSTRSAKMLELVQLSEKSGSYPHELSGGQKQRVALARACVLEPKVLLLDEPFSNLDTNLKEAMREFVLELQRTLKITTILVTHDKEEAFMTSQRVAVIFDGRIQQFDSPFQIYSEPKTKLVADFIGETNYIDGNVINGKFICPLGSFEATDYPSGAAEMMLKFDKISLSKIPLNGQNISPCKVTDKKYKGGTTTYKVAIKELILTLNSSDDSFEVGEEAFIQPEINTISLFMK